MVGLSCAICKSFIPLCSRTTICPECLDRLRKVLYPEHFEEDFTKPILDYDVI